MDKIEKKDIYNNTYNEQNKNELYNYIKEGIDDISKCRITEFGMVMSEIEKTRK